MFQSLLSVMKWCIWGNLTFLLKGCSITLFLLVCSSVNSYLHRFIISNIWYLLLLSIWYVARSPVPKTNLFIAGMHTDSYIYSGRAVKILLQDSNYGLFPKIMELDTSMTEVKYPFSLMALIWWVCYMTEVVVSIYRLQLYYIILKHLIIYFWLYYFLTQIMCYNSLTPLCVLIKIVDKIAVGIEHQEIMNHYLIQY